MIPLWPIHRDSDLGLLAIEHRVPFIWPIARRELYVWVADYEFWAEVPLPWYRRWAVAW